MNIDFEKVQERYNHPVVKHGLISPEALISAIHHVHREIPLNENGERDDGYRLRDVSAHGGTGFYGYKYQLEKDGEVILKSQERWVENKNHSWPSRVFRVGFDIDDVFNALSLENPIPEETTPLKSPFRAARSSTPAKYAPAPRSGEVPDETIPEHDETAEIEL
jgi:hypothetical protein